MPSAGERGSAKKARQRTAGDRYMKTSRKLAVAAILALLIVPTFQTAAYADNRRDKCDSEEQDDDCREKPRFQTKFFSE
jgi:hypothetical protein